MSVTFQYDRTDHRVHAKPMRGVNITYDSGPILRRCAAPARATLPYYPGRQTFPYDPGPQSPAEQPVPVREIRRAPSTAESQLRTSLQKTVMQAVLAMKRASDVCVADLRTMYETLDGVDRRALEFCLREMYLAARDWNRGECD